MKLYLKDTSGLLYNSTVNGRYKHEAIAIKQAITWAAVKIQKIRSKQSILLTRLGSAN